MEPQQQTITLLARPKAYAYEMENIARMFFPGQIQVLEPESTQQPDILAQATPIPAQEGALDLLVQAWGQERTEQTQEAEDRQDLGSRGEMHLGKLLYQLLAQITGKTLPWGILTGVRPVKLCHRLWDKGLEEAAIVNKLEESFLVSPAKAKLAVDTCRAENRILAANTPKSFSLYISIPFCPTRCTYCSFVSHDIEKTFKLVPDYVELLCKELEHTAKVARSLGLTLQTVYMGGGTPTTLEPEQLAAILSTIEQHFDLSHLLEYSVEAGRPDTITKEKLHVLKQFGVGRISINPQTMNDPVLKAIGRSHSAAQTLESYHLAREVGFDTINMDTIAGLPEDTAEGFAYTIDTLTALKPENITVHTLTVKRSSSLRFAEKESSQQQLPANMVEYAQKALGQNGYLPYYLYRQKATVQNLENTGFALPGHEGIYNVYIMDESQTILAAGAGAVSKLCSGSADIQRIFNYKFPYEYIRSFDEILKRKDAVVDFYERNSGA